ncbi:HNH endonuclease [Cellulomonas sp.]|uniref:HNH endonuclease n=1 Tax=Cellulomonas sp. TaxID=40001 RepID=UPI003BACFD7D
MLLAYETRCAICQLGHGSLLDAAHIVPDGEELGLPTTSNGLSLCKIHHAAYDQNMLGVALTTSSASIVICLTRWTGRCFGTGSRRWTGARSRFRRGVVTRHRENYWRGGGSGSPSVSRDVFGQGMHERHRFADDSS